MQIRERSEAVVTGKVQMIGFRKEQRRKNQAQNGTRECVRKLTQHPASGLGAWPGSQK